MNKALFLDRDGVINKEINYLHRIEDFKFIDGIFELCHFFLQRRYLLIVITNQAGIARGFYTEEDFHRLTDWMLERFEDQGIHIQQTYYCPFHQEAVLEEYRQDSFDRKPNPGMILRAQNEHNIDLAQSVLLGDKESDIEAGLNAGVGHNILFREGGGSVNSKAERVISTLPQALTYFSDR